ncbi:hypothetical protein L1987_02286 [Smallanthus sonchifolius]|uniref:Uncharacterized protein n=1 Tax=Smallanthus sonchifolius TaxID=185202 RepID=A0ACB9K7G4_9ASTR|nr:hypothetical protein L1987_02286 [Smallanthus sonchifolius]
MLLSEDNCIKKILRNQSKSASSNRFLSTATNKIGSTDHSSVDNRKKASTNAQFLEETKRISFTSIQSLVRTKKFVSIDGHPSSLDIRKHLSTTRFSSMHTKFSGLNQFRGSTNRSSVDT